MPSSGLRVMTSQPNPFSTRFTAAGRIPWFASDNCRLERIIHGWNQRLRRGAIVGPHGSGKTTLLEHLVPNISRSIWRRDATGKRVETRLASFASNIALDTTWLQLRRAERRSLSIPWYRLRREDLLVLDGFEQIYPWHRLWVLSQTWLRRIYLLVTSHRTAWLPTVCQLQVSPPIARKIITHLAPEEIYPFIADESQLQRYLVTHQGNMREVLMMLYDRVEQRRADGSSPRHAR